MVLPLSWRSNTSSSSTAGRRPGEGTGNGRNDQRVLSMWKIPVRVQIIESTVLGSSMASIYVCNQVGQLIVLIKSSGMDMQLVKINIVL